MTDPEFAEIVAQATSVHNILQRMHLAKVGTNYKLIRERITRLSLNTSHWGTKKRFLSLDEKLTEHSTAERGSLKALLIQRGLLIEKCAICGLGSQWQSKPLVLRLDHINGVRDDNRLINLRLLCPNCDSQTSTFCGRNKPKIDLPKKICSCGAPISAHAFQCKACQIKFWKNLPRKRKIDWPSVETLQALVSEFGYSGAGRRLGVTDNAIRKHLVKVQNL